MLAQVPNLKKYTCVNCSVGFQSMTEQRSHFKTEWHLYNLKRKVCKLEPIDLESFQKIQDLTLPDVPTRAEIRGTRARAKYDLRQQQQRSVQKQTNDDIDEEDDSDEDSWEEIDEEELLDEDYDEEEIQEMLARVVKSDTCLFCDKKSQSSKDNLEHMNSRHGFFVPEEQYLIDLEGLMEYLGFKVGAGMTCLWCNKQYTSLHGTRLHMLYKDHCKIMYNHEKAVEEFKDFYDYSSQEQIAMKPMNQLVMTKKRRNRSSFNTLIRQPTSKGSRQLVAHSTHGASLVSQTYHTKRSIKKFNAVRAKRLLHIGMQNNNAMRGRIRQQNPM